MLAGNFSVGMRVAGHGTTGTVIGPPSRSVLKAVAVTVRWDHGDENDERIKDLRPSTRGGAVRRPASAGAVVGDHGDRAVKSPGRAAAGPAGHSFNPEARRIDPASGQSPRARPTTAGGAGSPTSGADARRTSGADARRTDSATGQSPRTRPPASGATAQNASGAIKVEKRTTPTAGGSKAASAAAPSNRRSASAGALVGSQPDSSTSPMSGVRPSGQPDADSRPNPMRGVRPSGQPDSPPNPMRGVRPGAVQRQSQRQGQQQGDSPTAGRHANPARGEQAQSPRSAPASAAAPAGGRTAKAAAAAEAGQSVQPPKRRTKTASRARSTLTEAAEHPEAGRTPNPVEILRRHSLRYPDQDREEPKEVRRARADSQWNFADPTQTIIVFDWDDTLFPTTDLIDVLKLDWRVPLPQQKVRKEIPRKLALCEKKAVDVVKRAAQTGHVVVVTLAAKGWVEQACSLFYPKMGEVLKSLQIKIVNAQEKAVRQQVGDMSKYDSQEEYYGLLKGHAISEEVSRFYSQYEGQTWKNVLSIGDSRFERYGLLAASTAYMQRSPLNSVGAQPIMPGQQDAWKKVTSDGHVVHMRVKCCKLVDGPDIEELGIELDMIAKWLGLMVGLNEGFDLDFEALVDARLVSVVEGVLHSERPVGDLPSSGAAL